MQPTQSATLTTALIYVVVIGLFVYRMVRPQRMSVMRLWLMPIFLLAITVLSVWANGQSAAMMGSVAAPPWQIAIAMIVGALAGIPLGRFRGKHSEVKATDRPNVMYVHSSPLIVIVWLGAFALRAGLRFILPHAGATASVWGDAILAFAVSALITSYAIIYQRYKALPAPQAAQGATA